MENKKRHLEGVIVSDKMNKTRVVAITSFKKHPRYQKYTKSTTKVKVHDEDNIFKLGDEVIIEESRPISKEKRWIIKGKSEKAGESEDKNKGDL